MSIVGGGAFEAGDTRRPEATPSRSHITMSFVATNKRCEKEREGGGREQA